MPKIKISKGNPSLDMTPMVDLAFLLVTFFMLTASVRVSEPVIVDTPSSTSDKLLPDNVILITVDSKGHAFYNINNYEVRRKTLERMGQQYNVAFTDKEKERFGKMTSFGVPMSQLKQYINLEDPQRLKFPSTGVPLDSLHNELGDWIQFGRIEAQREANANKAKADAAGRKFKNEPLRFAIKADGQANYIAVKQVIKVFTDKDIFSFNLLTNLEGTDTKAATP
ncbi:MAG: ExbD/TolR family protein [Bacteroidia bacterium]